MTWAADTPLRIYSIGHSTRSFDEFAAFRGYADYMGTEPFAVALEKFLAFASRLPAAMMCAEAVWWRCHRALLADALVVRGIAVLHITSSAAPAAHQLNQMARIVDGRIRYLSLL